MKTNFVFIIIFYNLLNSLWKLDISFPSPEIDKLRCATKSSPPTYLLLLYRLWTKTIFFACCYGSKKIKRRVILCEASNYVIFTFQGSQIRCSESQPHIPFWIGWGCWRTAVAEAQSWDGLCVHKAQGTHYLALTEKGRRAPLSHTLFLYSLNIHSSKKPTDTFNILSESRFAKAQRFIRNLSIGIVLPIVLFLYSEALLFFPPLIVISHHFPASTKDMLTIFLLCTHCFALTPEFHILS